MIKLDRPAAPKELDHATATQLTADYLADNDKRVWNQPYIRSALLEMSKDKCAYCECIIVDESKYMEVDHFRPKKTHPDKVVLWSNLLPSCKRCNTKKGRHDVDTDGLIVDPTTAAPVTHLYFHDCILHYRDDVGRATIEACGLNQTDRLFLTRIKLMAAAHDSLEKAKGYLEDFLANPATNRKRNSAISTLENLLNGCGPDKQYAAFLATGILRHPAYNWLRDELTKIGMWSFLSGPEQSAKAVALL